MSEAIKPTPGPWYTDEAQPGDLYRYVDFGRGENYGYICRLSLNGNVNTEHNARLIAEAGTVHHETGLSPRQLVERVKELEEALQACAAVCAGETMSKSGLVSALEKARKVLSKSLPNTVEEVK